VCEVMVGVGDARRSLRHIAPLAGRILISCPWSRCGRDQHYSTRSHISTTFLVEVIVLYFYYSDQLNRHFVTSSFKLLFN
jgi:hypothetical protein